MPLIDAHCHASPLWYEPVEALLFQMDRNAVEKAVLTQLLGQFHNAYLEECVARFPARLASVGAVDPADPDAPRQIRECAARGMAGVRLRPDARSPAGDPRAIWRAAAEADLAISCAGPAALFLADGFAELVAAFPQTPFVLEHLGGWVRPDCDRTPAIWQGLLALVRFANVSIKIAALGQLAPRAISQPLPSAPPVLDESEGARLIEALDAFGAERLLWGSDFPVVSSREGYGNALAWTRALFAARTDAVDAVFGGNAQRIFFERKP